MEATELREMSDEQLQLMLKETTDGLFRLRTQAQTERLDAPSELRRHRRLIARIRTIQRERELNRILTVQARFLHKSNNAPITGSDYRARLFDQDVFRDDPMGEDRLDSQGRMAITCDLEDATKRDSFLALFEGGPDLYVVLEKESKEQFRSRPIKNVLGKGHRRTFNLGTFKV